MFVFYFLTDTTKVSIQTKPLTIFWNVKLAFQRQPFTRLQLAKINTNMLNIPLPASSDCSLASCLSLSPLCVLGVTVVCNLVCLGWPVVEIMERKSK